ncbi:MAG: hypothetical protein NC111_05925 [Bacteroides sp.]|nr:hypothetical protein [Bacteroides sp.]MCM1472046.1 hypothetical protein [Bacteroides sp.]
MGGYGGVLKNASIGVASADGKSYMHSDGKIETVEALWDNIAPQDDFLESMAAAVKEWPTISATTSSTST